MSNKLCRVIFSTLLAASVAVLAAQPAEARRSPPPPEQPGYVPPYGGNPEIEPEPDPYAPGPAVTPNTPVDTPTVVPVVLGGTETQPEISPDPGLDPAGGGQTLHPAPADNLQVLAGTDTRPNVKPAQPVTGVIVNTGAETLPLARAGLAALALGVGIVLLARRRQDSASA